PVDIKTVGFHSNPPLGPLRSVGPSQKPAPDHMCLDLGGTFEDVQDACVAQDAADLGFDRVSDAAMDLQTVICARPCDAGGEQLSHPSLDIAAATLVLLARREIGEFARHD